MQHLEVSGAVRHIYIYVYVIRRPKVKYSDLMCSVCLFVTAADLIVHSNSRNTAGRETDYVFKNAWGYTAIPPDIFGEWSYLTIRTTLPAWSVHRHVNF